MQAQFFFVVFFCTVQASKFWGLFLTLDNQSITFTAMMIGVFECMKTAGSDWKPAKLEIGNWKSDNETQIIRSASNLSCHAYGDTQYESDDMFCACSSSAPTLQKRDDSIGAPVSCPSPWRLWEPAAHALRLRNGDLIKRGAKNPEWYHIVIPSWNQRTAAQFSVPTLHRAMAAIWLSCTNAIATLWNQSEHIVHFVSS